jgi:tetratricopeptide (TPR) repeat protein
MPHDASPQHSESDDAQVSIPVDVAGLLQEFGSSGERGLLDTMMRIYETAFSSDPEEDVTRPELDTSPIDVFLETIGDQLTELYGSNRNILLPEMTISIYNEVLKLRPEGHERHVVSLIDLGAALHQSCDEKCSQPSRLQDALTKLRRAVELSSPGDDSQLRALNKLSDALLSLFNQSGVLEVLTERIGVCRVFLSLCRQEHPARFTAIMALASALSICVEHQEDNKLLAEAVILYRRALALCPIEDPDRVGVLSNLADTLQTQFEQLGDLDLLTEAVDLYRQALNPNPLGHSNYSQLFSNLASALHTLFEQLGELDTLAEAIDLHRQALNLYPLEHPNRSMPLNNLANTLMRRFEKLGDFDSLAEAVDLHRQALNLHTLGHPDHSRSLNNLASALQTRFEQVGDLETLTEAINLHRQALVLHPLGHADRYMSLNNLSGALLTRFEGLGDVNSLAEAVDLYRQALDLHSLGHPDRFTSISNLANTLQTRYEQFGDLDSLAEAVDLHRQALRLHPLGHSDYSHSLNNLACTLQTRFEQLGEVASLVEAIGLHRRALELRPLGHPYRSSSLVNLANTLTRWFEQLGGLDFLAEAIDLYRQALNLHTSGHPNRSRSLNNLASALQTRFEQLGDLDSLTEAVDLHRQALDLHSVGHSDRSKSLNNLANALTARFEQLGDLGSLAEAVNLHRQALRLHPLGHPDHPRSLSNLANTLQTRYEERGDVDTLAEVVSLQRQALNLYSLGHPDRSKSLHSLANGLQAQFHQLGDLASLAEAIDLRRQALNLHPLGHPDRLHSLSGLATALAAHSSPERDMDEELRLAQEGLQSCGDGHPMRLRFLFIAAECMLQRETHVFDFANGIWHILEGLRDKTSPARLRLREAVRVMRTVEAAYQSVTQKTGAAVELHGSDHDDIVLQAYLMVIRLLPQAASLGRDHTGRLWELSRVEALSRNAAARAIVMKREEEAVEMLEEGRGVFWAQALRLRGSELDLLPPEDARELKKLLQILEAGSTRDLTLTSAQQERHAEQRRLYSEAAEAIIADIRSRPGMERFLMPPAFTSLAQSLPEGFVVLLNIAELGDYALIMDGSARSVSSLVLKLPPRLSGIKRKAAQRDSLRDYTAAEVEVSDDELSATATEEEEPHRLGNQRERATLEDSFADLWVSIVKPVIDVLKLKVSGRSYSLSFHNLIFSRRGLMVVTDLASGGVPLATSLPFLFTLPVATLARQGSVLAPATNALQTTWCLHTCPVFSLSCELGALPDHCPVTQSRA